MGIRTGHAWLRAFRPCSMRAVGIRARGLQPRLWCPVGLMTSACPRGRGSPSLSLVSYLGLTTEDLTTDVNARKVFGTVARRVSVPTPPWLVIHSANFRRVQVTWWRSHGLGPATLPRTLPQGPRMARHTAPSRGDPRPGIQLRTLPRPGVAPRWPRGRQPLRQLCGLRRGTAPSLALPHLSLRILTAPARNVVGGAS